LLRGLNKEIRYGDNDVPEIMFSVKYSMEEELITEDSKKEIHKRLFSAIEKLSPRQKEAIYLKFQNGFDYNDISEIMDMKIEASRNLIYRAIKSLKESISQFDNGTLLLFIFNKLRNL